METYMDESLTPLDDGTIPDVPSPEEVNSMFNSVVGGTKKDRMYGCGSMASTIFPDDMAPCLCGGSSSSSRGSHETSQLREEWETQKRMNELLRTDLQATQLRMKESEQRMMESEQRMQASQMENAAMRDRMATLEEQVRLLVGGLPQPQQHPHTSGRVLFGRGSSPDFDPFAAERSSRRQSGKDLRYSQEYVPASQYMGRDQSRSGKVLRYPPGYASGSHQEEEDDDDDDDDGDQDDDETRSS